MEDARHQVTSLTHEGLSLLSETVLSDGKPVAVTATADTVEAARTKAQKQLPAGAAILATKVVTNPENMSTVVEAYDEGNANLSAVVQTHSQYGNTAVVQSVNLAKAGRRGFMGFAKKPNLYDVKVFRPAAVEVTYKVKAHLAVKMAVDYTRGLRPLGNKKRLTHTDEDYDVRLLLFRDRQRAEQYYDLFIGYAGRNPPPYLIEAMLIFIPKSIFAKKYGVAIPNEEADTRPNYKEWVLSAIRSGNETLRLQKHTDHMYKRLDVCVDLVYKWDILVPADFSETTEGARELLRDDENNAFPPLKVLGQEGVAVPPEKPEPQGAWLGVLFVLDTFDEALYGRAATRILFSTVGKQGFANCVIHGGDILPECKYWCSAIHTASVEQERQIEAAVGASSDRHFAPREERFLRGPEVPVRTLVFQGFMSKDGVYVGEE